MKNLEHTRLDKGIINLAETYTKEGVLKEKSANDASHMAMATASRADMIVSWTFKHEDAAFCHAEHSKASICMGCYF